MTERAGPTFVDYGAFDYGDPLARWFVEEGARLESMEALVAATGEQLVAHGIPLYRLSYLQRALHPELLGRGYFWRRGQPMRWQDAPHEMLYQDSYTDSPLPLVFDELRTVRYRLEQLDDPPFPVLRDLKAEGATDYVGMPVIFGSGHVEVLSVTSDQPGGFSRQHLDRMYVLHRLFGLLTEVHNLRLTATNLLDTYVGPDAGARILAGEVRRGDGRTLTAAIWFCDLRGFTVLSDTLPRDSLLDLLNDYFALIEASVTAEDGEILKFVGDGVLAIFQPREGRDVGEACARALVAARAARRDLVPCNETRRDAGKPEIAFGIGLHVGDVMYGNIGGAGRLDFTVIGPAVNLATRIESLSRRLDCSVLASADFAARCGSSLQAQGAHAVPGMERPVDVYAPAERE